MTSNLGGEYVHELASLGFAVDNKKSELEQQKETLKNKIYEALAERFRPEFLNRIDEIIIFNSLTYRDIEKIIDLQIEKINRRLLDKKICIRLTPAAKKYLVQKGYSPDYGARPLKRLIEKEILDSLADKIIARQIKEEKDILVDFGKKGLSLCQK